MRLGTAFIVNLALLSGCISARTPSSAPGLLPVLDRFTASDVPAMGASETATPPGRWKIGAVPLNLPGHGLAEHPMLYIGEGYDKILLVRDGNVIWTYSTGKSYEYDDVWMLSNGNVLFSRMQYVAEVTPEKKVVWHYDCHNESDADHTEIHCCQPIGLDKVLFVVNGTPPKLMVVNTQTGAVEVDHALPFVPPNKPGNVHGQFRRVRMTAAGTYLVPFMSMGQVVEYDQNFNEVWSYKINTPWAALRLKNGNTLITDERDHLTREVNSRGETVWEFNNDELPDAYRLNPGPQSCTRLANGNTIFCSRGSSRGNTPQLVEVTPDKRVVWVLQDWKTLGPATAVQILDEPGVPENPGDSQH
jgi:hypothetical protein